MAGDPPPRAENERWLNQLPAWVWPVAVVGACGLLAVVWFGGRGLIDVISFKSIGLNYDILKRFVQENQVFAVALYIAAYAMLGAFAIPGSALFVVASGLLFGAVIGIPLSLFASTVAATLAFLMARLVLGGRVARLTSPMLHTFKTGFARHALGYMLFLRLTPGLPFAAINVVPGLIGVSLSTFMLGTFVGLLPSRIALSTAGAGLAHVIDTQNALYSQCVERVGAELHHCPYEINVASLLTKETLAAFVALAVLALVPAIADAVRSRNGAG